MKFVIPSIKIILGVLLIAISAQLSVPLAEDIASAPITAQSLVVLVIAHIFKHRLASLTVFIYLLVGVIGLPVYSDFSSGIDKFSEGSLGYFIGFLVATFVVGLMAVKQNHNLLHYLLQMLIGTIIILLFGASFLLRFLPPIECITKGVLPFLIGGIIKVVLGAILIYAYHFFSKTLGNIDSK